MTDFTDLHIMAEMLGVRIVRHDGGVPGYYHHPTRTISTRRGMSARQYRSTLAHELGHATYRDTPQPNGHTQGGKRPGQTASRHAYSSPWRHSRTRTPGVVTTSLASPKS